MKARGCVADYRPWTNAERTVIRELYWKEATKDLAERLGRTVQSVRRQAKVLGICMQVRWTEEMDNRLREMWGDEALKTIASRLNRTSVAVYRRAMDIGLKVFAPEGFESTTAAAKRTGFDIKTLRRILEWAELAGITDKRQPVERTPWSPRTGRRWRRHIVESFEVDEAVAAWMNAETMAAAARARGTSDTTIKRTLRKFGKGLPPKLPGDARRAWRVPTAVIDAAMAARAAT